MRTFWKELLRSIFMGAVLPGLIISHGVRMQLREVEADTIPIITEAEPELEVQSYPVKLRQVDGTVTEMELERYLVGVVLGEMPAYFESEALKAQAVVARTYTLRIHMQGGKHGDSSICADPGCCQAYVSVIEYLERGGTGESVEKVTAAVNATAGEVLLYEEELIEATYFSCSGGITEDAQAVWGTDYPYLRSVSSPGEENASCFTDMVSFSFDAFRERMGMQLTGNPETWFGAVTYTAGSGVATIVIGGKEYTGTEARRLLGLRSTIFEAEVTEGEILIHTKGYGHRVGMSQYGAEAMAVAGSTYDKILAHYYQGTELADMYMEFNIR